MDFPERCVNAAWNRRTLLKSAVAMSATVGSIKSAIEASEPRDGSPYSLRQPDPETSHRFLMARKFCLECGRRNEYLFGKI